MGAYDNFMIPSAGGYISTYKGMPIEEMDKLGQSLEQNYYKGLENYSNLQIMMAQQDIRDIDKNDYEKITNNVSDSLNKIAERGDFERSNAQIAMLATKYASDKTVKSMMDVRAKEKEVEKIVNEMKIRDQVPIVFGGPENWGSVVDASTGKVRTDFKYDVESRLNYDSVQSKILDQLKSITSSIDPTKAEGIMEGYIRTGSVSGISDKRMRNMIGSAMADYQDTAEYAQQVRKKTMDYVQAGMSEQEAEQQADSDIEGDILQKGLLRVGQNVTERYMADKNYEATVGAEQEKAELKRILEQGFDMDYLGFQGSSTTKSPKELGEIILQLPKNNNGSYRLTGEPVHLNLVQTEFNVIDKKHGTGTTMSIANILSFKDKIDTEETFFESIKDRNNLLESGKPYKYGKSLFLPKTMTFDELNPEAQQKLYQPVKDAKNDYYDAYGKQMQALGWDGIFQIGDDKPQHINSIEDPQERIEMIERINKDHSSMLPENNNTYSKASEKYLGALEEYNQIKEDTGKNPEEAFTAQENINFVLKDLPGVDIEFYTEDNLTRQVEPDGSTWFGIKYQATIPTSDLDEDAGHKKMLEDIGYEEKEIGTNKFKTDGTEYTTEGFVVPGIMKKDWINNAPTGIQRRYNNAMFPTKDESVLMQAQRQENMAMTMRDYNIKQGIHQDILKNELLEQPENITNEVTEGIESKDIDKVTQPDKLILKLADMKIDHPKTYKIYLNSNTADKAGILLDYINR